MGVRARIGRWLGSSDGGGSSALADDLRALQAQVARLETAVNELRSAQVALDERQLDELDRIRAAVAAATDDLAARMTAVEERARSRA